MLTERIETLLVGNATGLVNTFKEGGAASDAFAAKTTTTGRIMNQLGLQGLSTGEMISKGIRVGSGVAALALGKMAFDGVQAFADSTAAARGFQRTLGGTAEDASRLSAATARMGIDAGTAQSAFGQLAKRIGEGKDTLDQWGVAVARNKDGSVNMAETLANISEKYRSIEDPAKRAAFASENFGKGYQTINSLLGQGKENLQEFYRVAAEHHQVFSQDDLDKGLQYSRSMKDLKSATEGFEMSLASGLIPLLTGLAKGLDAVFGVLSSASDEMGGFNLNAVAMGALIGTAINPGLGTLIGAGAGAAASLFNLGDSAADAESKMEKFDQQLSKETARKAATDFMALGDAASLVGASVDEFLLQRFRKLAEDSPAAAQKVIAGMQAMGEATGPYEQVLAKVVERKKEDQRQSDATKAANEQLTGSYDEQLRALDALQNAELAKFNNEIAAEQATLRAKDATNQYTQSLTDANATTDDQAKKLLDAESAALSAAAAAGKKAEADHAGEGAAAAHAAGTYAQIQSLMGLRGTVADGSPLAIALDGYIARLADPNVNGVHTTRVEVTGVAEAIAQLEALHNKAAEPVIATLQIIGTTNDAARKWLQST